MQTDSLALIELADLFETPESSPPIVKRKVHAIPSENGHVKEPTGGHAAKREKIKEVRDKIASNILKNGPMSAGEIKNHYQINNYQFKQVLDGCEWFMKDENEGIHGKYDLTPGGRAAAKVVAATPI